MHDDEWISSAEAAAFLGTDEQFVIELAASDILRSNKQDDQWFIERNRLERYKASWKKPRVDIAQIYQGAQDVLLAHYRTLFTRKQAQHAGTRGAVYEQLIRDFLRDYLPQQFYIGSGQVIGSAPTLNGDGDIWNVSHQTDVVIFDALHHPILLPTYELFPIEGTLAVIEVKSKLGTKELQKALENIASSKRLQSLEQTQPVPKLEPPQTHTQSEYHIRMQETLDVCQALGKTLGWRDLSEEDMERIREEVDRLRMKRVRQDRERAVYDGVGDTLKQLGVLPQSQAEADVRAQERLDKWRAANRSLDQQHPLGVVLAFESNVSEQTLIKNWQAWNRSCASAHRTEIICILDKDKDKDTGMLLLDTNRIDQLWDFHQIAGNPWKPQKLIAFQSEHIWFVFMTLLLRRLRTRSERTQELSTTTTPISYFRELSWEIAAEVDSPLDPEILESRRSFAGEDQENRTMT